MKIYSVQKSEIKAVSKNNQALAAFTKIENWNNFTFWTFVLLLANNKQW